MKGLSPRLYLTGYKAEEWTPDQLQSALKYPLRADFHFKLCEKKPRPFDSVVATTLPVYLSDASLCVPDHNDKLTVLAGSFKRLGTQVPKVSYTEMRKVIRYARKFVYPQFKTITPMDIKTTERWIEEVNHPEKRKEELREAWKYVKSNGIISPKDQQLDNNRPDDDASMCKSFIKDEKYEEEKAPRWINASSDLIKVVFGPIADAIMHVQCEHPATIKTVPVSERAKYIWDRLGGSDVIAQSSDASSMEDHYANIPDDVQSNSDPRYRLYNDFAQYVMGNVQTSTEQVDAIRFTFWRSIKHTPQPFELKYKLWTEIRDARTLGVFCKRILDGYRRLEMRNFGYVVVNAILCSGEMNTSSKNLIAMQVMVNYAQFELSGGEVKTVKSVGEGDDALAVYHKNFPRPTEKWWKSKGWLVKVEFEGLVSEASFCGLIFDPLDLVSVPDIRKTLCKFGFSNRRYARASRACLMSLLRSKAMSMACEYGDVPILGPLAHRLLYLTRHVNIRKSVLETMDMYERSKMQTYLKQKPWQKAPRIGIATRLLVEKTQSIPPGLQLVIESQLKDLALGSFTLPQLDFNICWRNNMSRCHTVTNIERNLNIQGRKRVVNALSAMITRDIQPPPTSMGWRRKIWIMQKQLRMLEKGSI